MPRNVAEWVGKSDDDQVPPRIRMRVLDRYGRCCDASNRGCGRQIRSGEKWTCDHAKAIINGGENREANLHPLCSWCDPPKTADDKAIKSKTYEMGRKNYGIKSRKRTIPGRKFDGTPIPSRWK